MSQGVEEVGRRAPAPKRLLFCDADIAFAPGALAALVRRAEADDLELNSLMAQLRCESFAERALIPAFVFFFAMLYPFAWVNDPRRSDRGGGGRLHARRPAAPSCAQAALPPMRDALIDDCALGRADEAAGARSVSR